ncbi:MFS transporter [Dehalobacter sp. DCM]|nr:MFS transporter [Dehalobacter sp. DCM]
MAGGLGTILAGCGNFIPAIIAPPDDPSRWVGPAAGLGIDPTTLTFWITMYAIGMAVSMTYVGKLWVTVKTVPLMLVSFVISIAAMAAMSFYNAAWQFYISGFIIGLSGGCYFMVAAPIIITNWFAKRVGLALGTAGILGSILIAVLSPIHASLVLAFGWRTAYLIAALISLVIAVPWILLVIRFKPEDKKMRPIGWEAGMEDITTGATDAPGVPVKKAVLSVTFIAIFIAAGLAALFGGYRNLWGLATAQWGYDPSMTATLISTTALFNVTGPFIGLVIDKIGAFKTTYLCLFLSMLASVGLYLAHAPVWLLLVLVFCFTFTDPVVGVLTPLLVRESFGPKDYSKILGYIQIGIGLIGGFSGPVIASIYSMSGNNFDNSILFGAVISLAALVLVFLAFLTRKKLEWERVQTAAQNWP